jgi:hypothetical protein
LGSLHSDILAGVLGELFGPWHKAHGWIYHASLTDSVNQLRNSIIEGVDDYGLLDGDKVQVGCEGLFLDDKQRDQFLIDVFGFGKFFDIWTIKCTMRCQIGAALRHIGQPATKKQIAELLQHPTQSISSILGTLEGIVRADRHRWGFQEWIADPYDGIFGEIEQRIADGGGSTFVDSLIDEISSRFNVSENSVRSYLASAALVVENGYVRLARSEDFVANSPNRCAGAVKIGDKWGYRYSLQDRHFKGYSLGVNFDVAYANGLRPGDDLMVNVEGWDSRASLIWRIHSLNRLVDVGRLSEYLQKNNHKPGDVLVLVPSRETIRVIPEQELPSVITQQRDQGHNSITAKPQESVNKKHGKTLDQLLEMLGDQP